MSNPIIAKLVPHVVELKDYLEFHRLPPIDHPSGIAVEIKNGPPVEYQIESDSPEQFNAWYREASVWVAGQESRLK